MSGRASTSTELTKSPPLDGVPAGSAVMIEPTRPDRRLQLRRSSCSRSRIAARTTTARFARGLGRGDCRVVCPRHGATFDLRTGAALTLPAYLPVRVFPVVVEEGIVTLDVDELRFAAGRGTTCLPRLPR